MVEGSRELCGNSITGTPETSVARMATLQSVEIESVTAPVEATIFIDSKLPEQLVIPQYALPDQAQTVIH